MKRKPIKKKEIPRNLTLSLPLFSCPTSPFSPPVKNHFLTVDGNDFRIIVFTLSERNVTPEVEFVMIPKQKSEKSLSCYPLNQKRYNHLQMVISPS